MPRPLNIRLAPAEKFGTRRNNYDHAKIYPLQNSNIYKELINLGFNTDIKTKIQEARFMSYPNPEEELEPFMRVKEERYKKGEKNFIKIPEQNFKTEWSTITDDLLKKLGFDGLVIPVTDKFVENFNDFKTKLPQILARLNGLDDHVKFESCKYPSVENKNLMKIKLLMEDITLLFDNDFIYIWDIDLRIFYEELKKTHLNILNNIGKKKYIEKMVKCIKTLQENIADCIKNNMKTVEECIKHIKLNIYKILLKFLFYINKSISTSTNEYALRHYVHEELYYKGLFRIFKQIIVHFEFDDDQLIAKIIELSKNNSIKDNQLNLQSRHKNTNTTRNATRNANRNTPTNTSTNTSTNTPTSNNITRNANNSILKNKKILGIGLHGVVFKDSDITVTKIGSIWEILKNFIEYVVNNYLYQLDIQDEDTDINYKPTSIQIEKPIILPLNFIIGARLIYYRMALCNAITLHKFFEDLKKITDKNKQILITQRILTRIAQLLKYYQDRCDFIHCDFHAKNIMIQFTDQDNFNIYFIDFNHSFIYIDELKIFIMKRTDVMKDTEILTEETYPNQTSGKVKYSALYNLLKNKKFASTCDLFNLTYRCISENLFNKIINNKLLELFYLTKLPNESNIKNILKSTYKISKFRKFLAYSLDFRNFIIYSSNKVTKNFIPDNFISAVNESLTTPYVNQSSLSRNQSKNKLTTTNTQDQNNSVIAY